MCKGDLEALVPHGALGVRDHAHASHSGASEIERKFRSSQQGLERDFEVERVGSKMEKTIVEVVLVIGVMSSRYWAMEAQVRETERVMVRMEA